MRVQAALQLGKAADDAAIFQAVAVADAAATTVADSKKEVAP